MFVLAIFLPLNADVSFKKLHSQFTILTLENGFFVFFSMSQRQMNLHLDFITSYVILDASWILYYLINGRTCIKYMHTHAANNNNIFVWFWSGAYREWPLWSMLVHYCNMYALYGSAMAGNSFHKHSNDQHIYCVTTTSTIHTHTHSSTSSVGIFFCLLFSLSHPKCIYIFSLPSNLCAVCLKFVYSTMFEALQKPCVWMTEKRTRTHQCAKNRRWNFIVHSFIRFYC